MARKIDIKPYRGLSEIEAQRFARKELSRHFLNVKFVSMEREAYFNVLWKYRNYICTDSSGRKYEVCVKTTSVYSITAKMEADYFGVSDHLKKIITDNTPKQFSSLIDVYTEYIIYYKPNFWQRIKDLFQKRK